MHQIQCIEVYHYTEEGFEESLPENTAAEMAATEPSADAGEHQRLIDQQSEN